MKPLCDGDQQVIADSMPQRIVDVLEVIQVKKYQRHLRICGAFRDGALHQLAHKCPIRQTVSASK